ncbi:MAG TPA: PQQ-dependent sugar dehydrogenase [Nitrososphaerales archaeon]
MPRRISILIAMLVLIIIASAFIMNSQLFKQPQESNQQALDSRHKDNKTNQQANQTTLEINAIPLSKTSVEVAFPNLSFTRPLFLTYANDDTNRLFVVLQQGQIMVFPNKQDTQATVFLAIDEKVNDDGNEEGLLGLAFDPDYKSNGYFYVYYTANSPRRSVISRFSVSDNDPNKANTSSELVIMEVPQPYSNHNGGMMAFGPDRMLYIGLGDGGSGGDPHGNGQNRNVLLGKILRIDISKSSRSEKYRIPADNPFVGQENSR